MKTITLTLFACILVTSCTITNYVGDRPPVSIYVDENLYYVVIADDSDSNGEVLDENIDLNVLVKICNYNNWQIISIDDVTCK